MVSAEIDVDRENLASAPLLTAKLLRSSCQKSCRDLYSRTFFRLTSKMANIPSLTSLAS